MKKHTRKIALIITIIIFTLLMSPLVSAQGTARDRAELVNMLSEEIKAGKQSVSLAYRPGNLTSTFVNGIIEEAVGRNLRSVCKTEGYSFKVLGANSVEIKLEYGKAKDYECFLAPTLSGVYNIAAQNIKSGRTEFAIFYPDERETQTLNTIVESLRENLTFYQGAGIDEYYMYNLLSVNAEAFEAADAAGGFVVSCNFQYAETPSQTRYVKEQAKSIINALALADKPLVEKVRLINNYVISHTEYLDDGKSESHGAYGLLKNKTAVCQGYALFTHSLLTEANVPCAFVDGYIVDKNGNKIPHLWNAVKTESGWRHLDTTWNDVEGSSEEYFLRDVSFMKKDHHWDEKNFNNSTYEIKSKNNVAQQRKKISLIVNDRYMTVGNELMEIDPGRGTRSVIINDRTMLPIRGIIEAAGGSVFWNDEEKQVTINYNDYICDIWIGKNSAILNGIEIISDTEPQIINERTMLPLRFVAESFGMGVLYDDARREVTVFY